MPVDHEASGVDLHLAARSGDVQVIRSLVQNPGVDLDARDILGDSGLLKAARYGHTEVVEALLFAGADVNAQDNNGWGPLHISIANNREGVFFALLSGGHESAPVNIEATTSSGDTPLHMAAYHGQKWAIEILLRLGANREAMNALQQRPIQVARHNTVRPMLRHSMTPGEKESAAAHASVIPAECRAGRPQDYDLEEAGVLNGPTIGERDYRTGDNNHGVQGKVDKGRVQEEVRRTFSGAMPLHEATRRQKCDELPSTEESTCDTAEEEMLARIMNSSSFISSLGSTEAEEEGDDPLVLKVGGDPVFEEGSSEGDFSQDSGGELP